MYACLGDPAENEAYLSMHMHAYIYTYTYTYRHHQSRLDFENEGVYIYTHIHTPIHTDIIRADSISRMKEGVVIINTSRGSLVDAQVCVCIYIYIYIYIYMIHIL